MALPTKDDLATMDFAFGAQPFVLIVAKSGIDLGTLDYAENAQPVGYAGTPATVTRRQIFVST